MYDVILKVNGKIISSKSFDSLTEAEEHISDIPHGEDELHYEIIDQKGKEEIDFGIIESGEDINDGIMDSMFPNEDSEEGFDWTLE